MVPNCSRKTLPKENICVIIVKSKSVLLEFPQSGTKRFETFEGEHKVTYVMSDIHGEFEKYREMLAKIGFSDEDTLYVLGDVADRGEKPVEVLLNMMRRRNVIPLMGNHDAFAYKNLLPLLDEIEEDNIDSHLNASTLGSLMSWLREGGRTTLDGFRSLSPSVREDALRYIADFSAYETVEVGGFTYVLVHAGLGNFSPEKKLSDYTLHELCEMRPDYDTPLFEDGKKIVVCGHTPTMAINGKSEIYHGNGYIVIDCGATFGGRLACLRLEDGKEFYV